MRGSQSPAAGGEEQTSLDPLAASWSGRRGLRQGVKGIGCQGKEFGFYFAGNRSCKSREHMGGGVQEDSVVLPKCQNS